MQSIMLVGTVIALIGLFLSVLGLKRLSQRRWLSGINAGFSSLGLLAFAVVILLMASNLTTYQRLVYESPVAEISFVQVAPAQFNVELLNSATGETQHFELFGDEWQLDAQIITWYGFATVLGFDAQYRLLRLSGRYADINDEKSAVRSLHALAPVQKIDVWPIIQKYQRWIAWADATYGSAVFLPMDDHARYKVAMGRTGLIARPDNGVAREAVSRWIGL